MDHPIEYDWDIQQGEANSAEDEIQVLMDKHGTDDPSTAIDREYQSIEQE